MSSRLHVLVPDGNSTWALSVIRCLSQVEDYKIFVLANKKRAATKYSRYTAAFNFLKRGDDEQWLQLVNAEIASKSIDIVVPIAEHEISFFIKHKALLNPSAKIIPLPSLEAFEIATNKKRLSDFALKHQISHPRSFYVSNEEERKTFLLEATFPVLIKPLNEKGGDGIKKILSKDKFPKRSKSALFIQEYIEGYDIDCSVLCLNGNILTHTVQKGNLKGHSAFAPQLGFDFIKNEEVLKAVSNVMSQLNWSGVAHLDLRYDELAQDYKLIEINARFWGSVEASERAGVNFPHLAIQLAINGVIPDTDFDAIPYMRLKGVLKSIKRRPSFIFNTKFLMDYTEVKAFLKDPLPTAYKFREWLGRRL
ncbi:MAG: ATP-grasp domain-containing protein [Algicola sp.]|nr:ATP-grasp domain-containing protein [Algicola sp.]